MRFWFTRELDLDLPVLKLLGGATVEEMVEDVVDRLSPALIPNVKVEAAEGEGEAAPEAAAAATNEKTDFLEVPEGASDTEPATGNTSEVEKNDGLSTASGSEIGEAQDLSEL